MSRQGITRCVGAALLCAALAGCGGASPDGAATLAPPERQTADQGPAHSFSGVYLLADLSNQITGLETTLTVPPEPPETGTLFLWPGLDPEPGGTNYLPINNGVLQPVLTWGPACTPGNQPATYSTWWISAQYVNPNGTEAGHNGCQGGNVMPVNVGDALAIEMRLEGSYWTQKVLDVQSGLSVNFSIDMEGQSQNIAYFLIEGYLQHPVAPTVFSDSTITFASPSSCALQLYGFPNGEADSGDILSTPEISDGGLTCHIAGISLLDPTGPVAAVSGAPAPAPEKIIP